MKNFKNKGPIEDIKDRKLNAPPVTKYMTAKLITFKVDTDINEAVDTLLDNRITGAPVLDDNGKVVGLIDDKDCLKILYAGAYYNHPIGKETVGDYMSNVMKTISVDDDLLDVVSIFVTSPYKRLLVMDHNGKLAGQISRRDVLRAIHDMNTNTW
jgi:predicted transcriptional regulator